MVDKQVGEVELDTVLQLKSGWSKVFIGNTSYQYFCKGNRVYLILYLEAVQLAIMAAQVNTVPG